MQDFEVPFPSLTRVRPVCPSLCSGFWAEEGHLQGQNCGGVGRDDWQGLHGVDTEAPNWKQAFSTSTEPYVKLGPVYGSFTASLGEIYDLRLSLWLYCFISFSL